MDRTIQRLQQQVQATESQLQHLKNELRKAELEAEEARQIEEAYRGGFPAEWIGETLSVLQHSDRDTIVPEILHSSGAPNGSSAPLLMPSRWPLSKDEYQRYGRQMIMPEMGLHGQLRLKNAKVLIVGVGGLGCPAAAYLAGAGVGTLGLMDGDTVEVSNLHRQIAHATNRIGMSKVDSACEYLQSLNPLVYYNRHHDHLSPNQAMTIFEQYDLILDCTDHPTSRYLISDACVLTGKPLVSASALKTDGQLIVLNNPPRPTGDTSGGPCYRCVFPKPPPAESVLSCGEGGILGPVVGVMGVLQALEAIKSLTGKLNGYHQDITMRSGTASEPEQMKPSMIMFSAYNNPQFRTVRLRSRRTGCAACSSQASITKQALTTGSLDYIAFCGMTRPINVLPPHLRISPSEFAGLPTDGSNMLIDVRDETQYAICALRGSVNVPWTGNADSWLLQAQQTGVSVDDWRQKYVVCRFGNDSQLAAQAMMSRASMPIEVKDITGGFQAWRQDVDHEWPDY